MTKRGADRPLENSSAKKEKQEDGDVLGRWTGTCVAGLPPDVDCTSPFRHAVLCPLMSARFLRAARDELLGLLEQDFKETDLFRVNQTGDFSIIDDIAATDRQRLSHVVALRDALYSHEFRAFVSRLTGLEDLSDRVDCAANVYSSSCHLLLHDDGMSTRRVSYIIYLSDDDLQQPEHGGALELYGSTPLDNRMVPAVAPSKCIPPLFNSMVLFPVLPGVSFHAVQEVYSKQLRRISIQGWFHGPSPVPFVQSGTLAQVTDRLFARRAASAGMTSKTLQQLPLFRLEQCGVGTDAFFLPAEDMTKLQEYMNPSYLHPAAIQQLRRRFERDCSAQLRMFLKPALADRIRSLSRLADERDGLGRGQPPRSYSVGSCAVESDVGTAAGGWVATGPPHLQRFLRYKIGDRQDSEKDELGDLLVDVLQFFFSSAFARWLGLVSGDAMGSVEGQVRRFRPGLDYTVAHYGTLAVPGCEALDVSLCFVEEEQTALDKRLWRSGDCGGFDCYIGLAEAPDAERAMRTAETYSQRKDMAASRDDSTVPAESKGDRPAADDDGGDELLSIDPCCNALSLVRRDDQTMKFTKYVTSAAPGSRFDVVAEYSVQGTRGLAEHS